MLPPTAVRHAATRGGAQLSQTCARPDGGRTTKAGRESSTAEERAHSKGASPSAWPCSRTSPNRSESAYALERALRIGDVVMVKKIEGAGHGRIVKSRLAERGLGGETLGAGSDSDEEGDDDYW